MTNNLIEIFSEKMHLPRWWIELVIIEYSDCRHFFVHNELSSIDFNTLSKEQIEPIPTYNIVMPSSHVLFHNTDITELRDRVNKALIGDSLTVTSQTDIIVNGLANFDCFAASLNSFDRVDPKRELGNYCIVLDHSRFYQWKIGNYERLERSGNGRYKSDIFSARDVEKINDEIVALENQYLRKEIETIKARLKAVRLFRRLEEQRAPIRRALLEYHQFNKNTLPRVTIPVPKSISDNNIKSASFHTKDTFGTPHYIRPVIVTIENAYKYFSDIESYPERYSDYCKKVEVIEKNSNNLSTKEFWNIFIGDKIDHVILNIKYSLIPPNEIHYEVTDASYSKAIGIKNAIFLSKSRKGIVFVHGNNVLLDILCYPPHRIKPGDFFYIVYHDMISYFKTQDCIYLENKNMEGFKEGQLCSKCNKGHLENSPKKEDYREKNFRVRTKVWICNFCKQEFTKTMVETGIY